MPVHSLPAAPFICAVVRVHDGDGPLWCTNGIKVRIAGVQAPDYEDAEPCRRRDARRMNYTCDNTAADRSQQIVERMVLRQTMICQPVGMSYARVVARCTFADGRSLSVTAAPTPHGRTVWLLYPAVVRASGTDPDDWITPGAR